MACPPNCKSKIDTVRLKKDIDKDDKVVKDFSKYLANGDIAGPNAVPAAQEVQGKYLKSANARQDTLNSIRRLALKRKSR